MRKSKQIAIMTYCYSDGLAILATENEIYYGNYWLLTATKKNLIKNFYEILTSDNCSPTEAKEILKKMTANEIIDYIGAIVVE